MFHLVTWAPPLHTHDHEHCIFVVNSPTLNLEHIRCTHMHITHCTLLCTAVREMVSAYLLMLEIKIALTAC